MRHCNSNGRDVDVRIYKTVSALPESWNAFLPQGHFLRTESLNLNEEANFPGISFLYVLIESKNQIQATGSFQLLSIKKEHLKPDSLKWYQRISWNFFIGIFRPKLLISGHLFRHDINSFYTTPDADNFQSFLLYQQCIETALKNSCAQAILVKDTPSGMINYFQHYMPQYLLLRNDISMEMSIPQEWNNMEDYEKALKHKYAQRFRKIKKAFDTLQIKEMNAAEVVAHQKQLYNLYQQVGINQQVRLGFLSETFLPLLKQQYPETLLVWGIYEDDKLIAFVSAWLRENVFDMFYIGFDYEQNEKFSLYFNIIFFSLQKAIEHKKEKLVLGRTALEAKARLGCKPRYLHTFLFIRNSAIRKIVTMLQQNLQTAEGEWEQRHPMK